MGMMRWLIIPIFFVFPFFALAQTEQDTVLYAVKDLPQVIVFDDKKEYWKYYYKAKHYVARVYPYALLVKDLNAKFNRDLASVESKSIRKKYIKKANKALKAEFDGVIRNMSENEGRYLVKLIHRETGLSAYGIIKKFKGNFSASTWQTLSKMGGANLKLKYDLNTKEDYVTEIVLSEVRSGKIKLDKIEGETELGKMLVSKREKRRKAREAKRKARKATKKA